MKTRLCILIGLALLLLGTTVSAFSRGQFQQGGGDFDSQIEQNVQVMMDQGRETFRFNTFGDEAFWGDTLRLHEAIKGEALGGIGPGVSPNTALSVGLKVDVDALPAEVQDALKAGQVDLDDPATTVTLLQLNSVVGVQGVFNKSGSPDSLNSMGIT